MSWFRKQAHKVAARVAASTDGEIWRRVASDHGTQYERRKGLHFPDMDALGSLLERFTELTCEPVSARAAGGRVNFFEPGDVADQVARLPAPADRASFGFTASRSDGAWSTVDPLVTLRPSWSVDLRSTPGSTIYLSEIGLEGRKFGEALIEIVERHVADAPRGTTETAAVVEPISLETASQRAHDAKVASKAARVGGWWGALGGAAVGGIVTLAINLATGGGGGS